MPLIRKVNGLNDKAQKRRATAVASRKARAKVQRAEIKAMFTGMPKEKFLGGAVHEISMRRGTRVTTAAQRAAEIALQARDAEASRQRTVAGAGSMSPSPPQKEVVVNGDASAK
jgi:hypothetical protein